MRLVSGLEPAENQSLCYQMAFQGLPSSALVWQMKRASPAFILQGYSVRWLMKA
jgi:hypothetical protein